jgi:hypothetical protein
MILHPLFLYENQQVGSDALGNPINERIMFLEGDGRFSSWTSEEIALDNRDVTKNNRKILTWVKREHLERAEYVKIDGKYHKVTEIKGDDYQRWRIVVVDRYGTDVL